MTDVLPPLSMYANATAVQLSDPFRSAAIKDSTAVAAASSLPHYFPTARKPAWDDRDSRGYNLVKSVTTPPDMNTASTAHHGLQQHGNPAKYHQHRPHQQQDHHNHASSNTSYHQEQQQQQQDTKPYYTGNTAQTSGNAQELGPSHGRNGFAVQSNSRPISPVRQPQQQQQQQQQPDGQSQRPSQRHNSIAAAFQIPKSVNESGGSLSELAAQITCLFWFESSEFLQQVEESPYDTQPSRQLVPDAKPTMGFRKWVTTILSTTLVAQNVVLLALLFIYRLKKLNPGVKGKPGSEYRLLTVALMLGNKFLDDNTYTNKTWAEVSGINVGEVHIMEVEFLSNMKYCLFTSAEDWKKWQQLLGRFATFFDRASRPAPILPPAASIHLPMALPSPPASNQSSPPYAVENTYAGAPYSAHGPTPTPSPLTVVGNGQYGQPISRKRSMDDPAVDSPAKRIATGQPPAPQQPSQQQAQYHSPRHQAVSQRPQLQPVPRLPLPSLQIPVSQGTGYTSQAAALSQQTLPPLNLPAARAMTIVYPPTSQPLAATSAPASTAPLSSQPSSQLHSQHQSRQQSPYPGSGAVSPAGPGPHSASSVHPGSQISPSYFLQQRNSPYRPVHNVSTLLYPPPSATLQQRPQNVELNQMCYQPLGRPTQRQTGRLPYVVTPVHQWPPGYAGGYGKQQQQQHQPNP